MILRFFNSQKHLSVASISPHGIMGIVKKGNTLRHSSLTGNAMNPGCICGNNKTVGLDDVFVHIRIIKCNMGTKIAIFGEIRE